MLSEKNKVRLKEIKEELKVLYPHLKKEELNKISLSYFFQEFNQKLKNNLKLISIKNLKS